MSPSKLQNFNFFFEYTPPDPLKSEPISDPIGDVINGQTDVIHGRYNRISILIANGFTTAYNLQTLLFPLQYSSNCQGTNEDTTRQEDVHSSKC
jgi:hypothetical protein